MEFEDKARRSFNRIKSKLIVGLILWLILVIVFVAPFGVALYDAATQKGVNFSEKFFSSIGENIVKPITAFGKCLSGKTEGNFGKALLGFSIIYLSALLVGFVKGMPKHEFDGIENGSSDWCVNGEQYKILNKKSGIILAEKNYLPVDKRGNVNVLVVGRFRCW